MALKHSNPTRYRIDRQGRKQWARSPYNFVPLPEKMIAARTPLDHDLYHEKGLTGWIDCELETCSPTYVRGMLTRALYDKFDQKSPDEDLTVEEKNQMAPFFSTEAPKADALPTIPGSTLRGMIRALVEIAGYGRMRWVTPSPTFTFRAVAASKDDPLSDPYREALGKFGNKVKAGYLEQKGDRWFVRPAMTPESMGWPPEAAYLKIKEEHIDGKAIPGFRRFNSPNYEPNRFEVSFEAEVRRGKRGPYVAILEIGGRDKGYEYKGILTCSGNMLETGKENQKSPRKKHALVLPMKDDRAQPLEIPEQAIRDYRDGMTPFQKEKLGAWGGKDWGCLKHDAPVFYVAEGNEVLYFGHSPNFRIPMRLFVFEPEQRQPHLQKQKDKPLTRAATPLDFVPEAVRNDQRPDLAEAIFGWVEEKDGPKEQRAGRVFFSDARYIGYIGPLESFWLNSEPIAPHTLSSPKPTTFQHYLVQDRSVKHNPDEKSSLAHYGTSPLETQIRGHKGYWHKGTAPDLHATEKERGHEKQLTRIRPLRPGVRFTCKIYFENLREEELGALWWALTLPGDSGKSYRHKLGMGKSLGMGAVSITPRLHLTERTTRYTTLFNTNGWEEAASEAEAQPYLAAFEKFVLSELGLARNLSRLAQVERVQALLALLSWPGPDPSQTRYMEIEHPQNENEYKERPVLPDAITVLAGVTFLDRAIDPAPPTQPSKSNRPADYVEGVVKKFGLGANQDFGFIQPTGGGKDVFVHKNQLAKEIKTLNTGDRVRFKVIKGVKGLQAQDVSLIE